MRNARMLQIIS